MTLAQVRDYAAVDRWSPDNENGYQRPAVIRRYREVAKYVAEEQGILPTSVLLATRPEDHQPIEFVPDSSSGETEEWGLITIPESAVLWLVDGQHRYFGVQDAYERGLAEGLDKYPFPVTIMENIERYTEMTHFNLINTTQKKMATDIVDRHLVQQQEREGLGMIASGTKGIKRYQRARATRVVDQLNEIPGPWKKQIAVPGVDGRDKGLIRQHALVASLEPVMGDSWVTSLGTDDDTFVKILSNFWGAMKDVWPDVFDSPKDYRLQATVGVYSMHRVLPSLIERCRDEGDLTQDTMADMLRSTGIDSTFWHKESGDPYTLGTGMASIRALAQYITELLPRRQERALKV